MPKCEQCGKEVELPFECSFCGHYFCAEHRLPENHNCPNQPTRTPLGSWQTRKEIAHANTEKQTSKLASEGDYHFIKEASKSEKLETKKPFPIRKVSIFLAVIMLVVIIGTIILLAPNISSLIQQSTYTKLTLPIGAFVYSTQQNVQYTFRYGGLLGDEPNLLQVWVSGNAFPKDLSISKGATYTAFAIEIKISEIHEDYIVILVKPL